MLDTANQPQVPNDERSHTQEIHEIPLVEQQKVVFVRKTGTPEWVFFGCIVVMVALLSYIAGIAMLSHSGSSSNTTSSTTSMSMDTSNTTSNVPDATQTQGNQPAKYTIDPDGAKHFTLVAQQVMWEVVKGHRELAWTINGTVPGPTIHLTAGDHVRITVINHFPKPTAIHWHGLEVPTQQDGVVGLGQANPIEPGQSFVYDFTVGNQDIGTHWYHSHYDDAEQVAGGCYGAVIVDPKPGSPQAAQAIHADVEYTEFIGMLGSYYVINGKSFPNTDPIIVKHGQTVHIRLIGADTQQIHPMHLHGHIFSIVAEDGHALSQPIQKDTIQVAPGETYDIVFNAWAKAGAIYPFHCHILSHLMNPGQTGDEMGGLIVLVKYV